MSTERKWAISQHDGEYFLEYRDDGGTWVQSGIFFPGPHCGAKEFMEAVNNLNAVANLVRMKDEQERETKTFKLALGEMWTDAHPLVTVAKMRADLALLRADRDRLSRELENLRAQMVEVPAPRLDLVNDFAKGEMLIGGPCIHGVSNNGFDCPKCHPPLDLGQAIADTEKQLKQIMSAAREPKP